MKAIALIVLLLLSGCSSAGLLHELKTDPSIVGSTGLWISLGFEPSVATAGIPTPSLKFGYGTLWRVGPQNEVEILIGGGAGSGSPASSASTATPGQPLPQVSGNASLYIRAKGAKEVLVPMKDLYKKDP